MKRYILAALAVLLICAQALAVPARPGAFSYRQPDGSVIRLELHGDEFFSWTTLAGTTQVVALSADGFYRPATISENARQRADERRRTINRQRTAGISPFTHTDNLMTHGERHIPVILIQFKDVKFKLSAVQEKFTALLNEHGYSDNGGTGSVQDYFLDNSGGAFKPVFDVYGPVTLDKDIVYYGEQTEDDQGEVIAHDKQPELALYDACLKLDSEVDFSVYDYDNDGFVDMTLFYYAGYSQAEGASKDSIWPHQWSVQSSASSQARSASFDGLRLGKYFCTAELRGNSGSRMCGIGVTTHEFGHSLGLPDFYDTDYEKNGSAGALYSFSIMCSGSYLNDACTPPYYNAEERIMLGWMIPEDVQELPEGTLSFGSIKDGIAYKSYTETEGEYFVYECRDGSGWDAFLPRGLVVYHADKSSVRNVGGHTPKEQWEKWTSYNTINAYGDHPCFYVVPAADQSSLNYKGDLGNMVFPGAKDKRSYIPIDWEGNDSGISLSNIWFSGGEVSMKVDYTVNRTLIGTVMDASGTGIGNVMVVVSAPAAAQSPRPFKMTDLRSGTSLQTLTDAQGRFSIDMESFEGNAAHVTLSKAGFLTIGYDITLRNGITSVRLALLPEGYDQMITYKYYDERADRYLYGDGKSLSLMAAFRVPAAQLPQQGSRLNTVSFVPYFDAQYYIVVDSGEERILTQSLDDVSADGKFHTINLYDLGISIPGGKDLYVGVAVENAQCPSDYTGYLFMTSQGTGNIYISSFDLNRSHWSGPDSAYYLDLLARCTVIPGSESSDPAEIVRFGQMGMNAIPDAGNGVYAAGTAFPLEVDLADGVSPASITWTHNGRDVTGASSATLTSGRNILVAVLTMADGSTETLELELNVQ